jgi:hypothetical protein
MSLYEKIYNVMNESEGLEKDLIVGSGSNSYKAVGEKEVLNMLKPLFKKHKLIVFPVDGDISEANSVYNTEFKGEVTTKTRNVTQIKVKFKIVDVETGESELLMGFGNGADSQDKGSGKAFTYAFKTMLNKTFMLFSGEDTDNEHSDDIGKVQKPPQQSKPAANTKAVKVRLDGGTEKATVEQVKAVFAAGRERAKNFPDFDMFKWVDDQADEGKITTKWPYANKEKTAVNWTIEDVTTMIDMLGLPF